MTEPILEASHITVRRNDRLILDDISISIPPEARQLIQGKSGAGKTTLFHIFGLLDVPTTGDLFIEGTDVNTLSKRERAELRRDTIGIIFQDFQLVPDLTALENAALPQEHSGSVDEAWLHTLFTKLDMADRATHYPATLSGGEKQRVSIARALANKPSIILADEPTGQLDPKTAENVMDLLFSLQADTGTALVVVSHDVGIADKFPKTSYIKNGRLQSNKPTSLRRK